MLTKNAHGILEILQTKFMKVKKYKKEGKKSD
jgi:hypothetical protein